jgi:hypothetical protein
VLKNVGTRDDRESRFDAIFDGRQLRTTTTTTAEPTIHIVPCKSLFRGQNRNLLFFFDRKSSNPRLRPFGSCTSLSVAPNLLSGGRSIKRSHEPTANTKTIDLTTASKPLYLIKNQYNRSYLLESCHGGVSRVTTGCAGEGSRNKGQKLDHG